MKKNITIIGLCLVIAALIIVVFGKGSLGKTKSSVRDLTEYSQEYTNSTEKQTEYSSEPTSGYTEKAYTPAETSQSYTQSYYNQTTTHIQSSEDQDYYRQEQRVVTDARYILNTNTKKFHYPTCSSVDEMKEKNKQPFNGTREEAINMGYVPCKRCNP